MKSEGDPQTIIWSYFSRWMSIIWIRIMRPVLKGFLRRTTGLCELQRICYSTPDPSAERSLAIESSLLLSRSSVLKRICQSLILNATLTGVDRFKPPDPRGDGVNDSQSCGESDIQIIEYAVDAICLDKEIKRTIHTEFIFSLRISLKQIYSYKKLAEEALRLSGVPFDKKNDDHQKQLSELWRQLKGGDPFGPEGQVDWSDVGFQQSTDPSTDFRGMGILGLKQLVYFSQNMRESAVNILSHSCHPIKGYPFAITGINMSHLTLTLMIEGNLKSHFFNLDSGPYDNSDSNMYYGLEDLHRVYSYLFCAFDKFWISENPKDVMEFRYIKEKFVTQVISHLNQSDSTLINWSCPIIQNV